MLKKTFIALSLASVATVAPMTVAAQTTTIADPARQKLAEDVITKLVPPGTYQRLMNDMAKGDLMQQILGMKLGEIAGMVGANPADKPELADKTLMDLASERDPNFKERMDISMKVMFEEMGALFATIEPDVRAAMARIYARKYDAKQLADMNAFFATPSGSAFAQDFMSSFMDKEIIGASMKAIPAMVKGMPKIIAKVEAATAHLPPMRGAKIEPDLPGDEAAGDAVAAAADAAAAAADAADYDNGTEPWYDRENWSKADQSKVAKLESASNKASGTFFQFEETAIARTKERYLKSGWTPAPSDVPMAAEDIPADAVPPPAAP